jgi:four helix bundle protein
MSKINSYKDLIVWQKTLELSKEIYLLTKNFPKEEQFGLISQMRRASVSILSNIAEGSGRYFSNEWKQFCSIAYGSALELESQLILCRELGFINENTSKKSLGLLEEVSKMLLTILKNLRINSKIASQLNSQIAS